MSYIPATPEEKRDMLGALGMVQDMELYADVPEAVRLSRPLEVEGLESELGVLRRLADCGAKNTVYKDIYMGAGAYRHFIPAALETLSARGEFVTAYTPYQAEMSQGILQSIFEYQTMICELTGMDVSNASVYDGASAAGEACIMSRERSRSRILLSAALNPMVISTVKTYVEPLQMKVDIVPAAEGVTKAAALGEMLGEDVAAVVMASPNYFGLMEDLGGAAEAAHAAGAKLIAYTNPIAAAIYKTPGELGADITVGEGQPLGLPIAFGGPYLGYMACTKKLMRKMPGRIVGQTVDAAGNRAFVLTLQAREQHIRREKAGSNICSNQAWCALRAAMYMTMTGREGMREVALQCYANAHYLRDELEKLGFEPQHSADFFHEFVTTLPVSAEKLQGELDSAGILGGLPIDDGKMLWCATELTGKSEIDRLAAAIKEAVK